MPDTPSIFISYRRIDTGGHARALYQELARRFGEEWLFFDRSSIESGDDFPTRLRDGGRGCKVLLALSGPDWLGAKNEAGGKRLDDSSDFVRQEIALALEYVKKIIPVLFDDTPVPRRHELPSPLQNLAAYDALPLRGKTLEYEAQLEELI